MTLEGPPRKHRYEPVRDGFEVVDEVALAHAGIGEQRLVEVRQLNREPFFLLGHGHILPS